MSPASMNRINCNFALSIALFLFSLSAFGLDSDRQQPLKIVADTATIDEKESQATYTGSVVLTQGTLKIVADTLIIKTKEKRVEKVMATGAPALFSQVPAPGQAEVIAKARNIDYLVKEQTLLLMNKASIVQDENVFRGEKIRYEIQSQRLKAEGDSRPPQPGGIRGRVEMILPAAGQTATEQAEEKLKSKRKPNNTNE